MKNHMLFLIFTLSSILIVGCKQEDDKNSIVATESLVWQTLKPTGTISGKVVDRHTDKPVNGVIVSIAFNGTVTNATSDISGSFSFANVPCNRDATTGTITGTYQLTVSLVEVNKTIPDSLPKFREYYFNATLSVTFIDVAKNDTSKNKVLVEGLEANIRFDVAKLNTTINGYVVDENNNAVANAAVWLREFGSGKILQQTTTNTAGKYSFTKVEDGTTIFIDAKSSDGTLQGSLAAMTLVINRAQENLRPQVTAERILITAVDNVAPYVISISPENLADVSPNGLTMVYKFSEPIKQTAYTVTNAPLGLGTLIDDINFDFAGFKKAAGNTNFALSWDSTFSILTVTPAQIVGSSKYTLNVVPALGKLKDRAGNAVVAKAIVGDFETLNFTTNGGTTIPSAPIVTRRLNTGLGLNALNFTGGVVGLEWNLDANARNYKVYRSVNGEPYTLLANNIIDTRYSDNTGFLVTGYNPPTDRDAFKAFSVIYKVHTVSKDLIESDASNIISVKDDVAPKLISAIVDSLTTGFDYAYLRFDEPLTTNTAQTTAYYAISNLPGGIASQITEAVYLAWTGTFYEVRLQVTKQSVKTGEIITVTNQVKDLAGNSVDPNTSSRIF